ncbi:MAG: carbohydrate-binding family 9-like protein [Flavobacteriia bacterium]|nr:MAG: carbohydrate-binding family 9-like protein [Flavobacteriia bacterium]
MKLFFNFFLYGLVIILLVSCGTFKKVKKSTVTDISPKKYIAYYTPKVINIDGKLNEEAWKKAPWTELFIDIEGKKKPKYNTRAKMLWDDTYFYIIAELEEPHVWADITKHDAIIFHNNDFEVFVEPDNNGHDYYELEINALNTTWDLFITEPYRELDNYAVNDFEIKGLKSAISINGTLNNPNDIDKGWVVEMAIPWEVYKRSYYENIVPRDKFWRVNFSRVNWDHTIHNGKYSRKTGNDGKFLPEYNWVWSPQGVINIHEPEKWGYVYFSSKKIGEKDSFSIPDDERIKWKLFEFYRKQKSYYLKHSQWITSLDKLNAKEFTVLGKLIQPRMENHSQGFVIIVKSPFTGNEIIINEEGKLTVKK